MRLTTLDDVRLRRRVAADGAAVRPYAECLGAARGPTRVLVELSAHRTSQDPSGSVVWIWHPAIPGCVSIQCYQTQQIQDETEEGDGSRSR